MDKVYIDPVIEKYKNLIEANMPGVFKAFYQGDPINVPASSLPALVISRSETRVGTLTNSEDEHGQALTLSVITDIRQEINDDKEIVPGVAMLYNIVEGRNADTLILNSNSILGILRQNENVDTAHNLRTDLGTVTRVNYEITVGKRQPEQFAIEAQVEFIAYFTQNRN